MKYPYSLEAFHDFCVRKGDETFQYTDPSVCACAQYAGTLGISYAYTSCLERPNPPFWAIIERLAAALCIKNNFRPVKFSDLAARVKEVMANE